MLFLLGSFLQDQQWIIMHLKKRLLVWLFLKYVFEYTDQLIYVS